MSKINSFIRVIRRHIFRNMPFKTFRHYITYMYNFSTYNIYFVLEIKNYVIIDKIDDNQSQTS